MQSQSGTEPASGNTDCCTIWCYLTGISFGWKRERDTNYSYHLWKTFLAVRLCDTILHSRSRLLSNDAGVLRSLCRGAGTVGKKMGKGIVLRAVAVSERPPRIG